MLPRYIGRFAPSPSGPLHFGSLVCALASYLDAKANDGTWLVRMEDIDPPRELLGASTTILTSLEKHGLCWDGEVLYQSSRKDAYQAILSLLKDNGFSYRCSCTRKQLQQSDGLYSGYCLSHPPDENVTAAVRLNVKYATAQSQLDGTISFSDRIQGEVNDDLLHAGDFIIHRKDGLFAYHLAVVADDIEQGVTDIVRGIDLLEMTGKHILLTQCLSATPARYAHIPIIINDAGYKLTKQHGAPGIDDNKALQNLIAASRCLGLEPSTELTNVKIETFLHWATKKWAVDKVPKCREIKEPQ